MKHLKTLAKALFVFGLLYFLTQKGFISVQDTRRAFDSWPTLLVVFLILGCQVLLGALRWQWLLKAQSIELKWLRVLELTAVGNFFNIALPGAVSGDFIKAFYIGKDIPGQRARAFGGILFDRIAGLSALVLIAGAAMILGYESSPNGNTEQMYHVLRPLVIFAAICTLLFYAYLFLVKENWDPVLLTIRKLEKSLPAKLGNAMNSVGRIYEGIRHYHHHRWTVLKALMISLVVHMTVGWAFLEFAHAFGADHLSLLAVYTIFPLGLLVTAVPVAPAGLGTGHAAFLYLFNLIGCARGADIFTLYALSQLFYGFVGGVVYLRFKGQLQPIADPQTSPSS
jgi:uncharacterized protein (TIRG00374 family)